MTWTKPPELWEPSRNHTQEPRRRAKVTSKGITDLSQEIVPTTLPYLEEEMGPQAPGKKAYRHFTVRKLKLQSKEAIVRRKGG